MAKAIKDGKHVIAGFDCETENGVITKVYYYDVHGVYTLGTIYKANVWTYRPGGHRPERYIAEWYSVNGVTPDAFRAGIKRGTYTVK